MVDSFESPFDEPEVSFISHGKAVKKIVERNNPLADIERFNIGCIIKNDDGIWTNNTKEKLNKDLIVDTFKKIIQRIKDGEKIDAINCSFEIKSYNLLKPNDEINDIVIDSYPVALKQLARHWTKKGNEIIETVQEITQNGTRIIFSAGNRGKRCFNQYCRSTGAEFTGALANDGKIADFSSSRQFCQHYERGMLPIKLYKDGMNITGKPGIDIPYKDTWFEKFQGKKPQNYELLNLEDFKSLIKKCYAKTVTMDEIKKLNDKLVPTGENMCFCFNCIDNKLQIHSLVVINDCLAPHEALKSTLRGTSFAAPQRTAKITLNEAMKEILNS